MGATGEDWTFFEIDPEVIRIARDPKSFRFLSACAPNAKIVPGDGRLTLAASSERYDLIVLDAFSSDAIPVHLLTREALAGYLSRLKPGGVIILHVSNRHLELASVAAAVGAADGLVAYYKEDDRANDHGGRLSRQCPGGGARALGGRSRRPAVAPRLAAAHAAVGRGGLDRRLFRRAARAAAQEARAVSRSNH